jgi:hypothetical protein
VCHLILSIYLLVVLFILVVLTPQTIVHRRCPSCARLEGSIWWLVG